jgi:hypothetical protein
VHAVEAAVLGSSEPVSLEEKQRKLLPLIKLTERWNRLAEKLDEFRNCKGQ